MRKKRVILELAAILVAAALLFAVLAVAGAAAVPFGNGFGATWGSYRAEEPDSADVLYFGSSMVYCDVAPAVVYDESGLTGFVMAGPDDGDYLLLCPRGAADAVAAGGLRGGQRAAFCAV